MVSKFVAQMKAKEIYFCAMKQYRGRFKPVLYYFFAGLLLSLLTWQQTSASSDSFSKSTLSKSDFSAILSHSSNYGNLSQLHLPFESEPAPREHEVPDENELEEDVDFDYHFALEEPSFERLFSTNKPDKRFNQTQTFTPGYTQVPLFILYHSWKSFMC